jgi:hypothetical protein
MKPKILAMLAAAVMAAALAAGPASASAAPVRASLPACSETVSHGIKQSPPTAARRAPVPANSSLSCETVVSLRVPNPAQQGRHLPSANTTSALIYCKAVITLRWTFPYNDEIWSVGHFDCSGYIPYYMAIEVGVLNSDPNRTDIVGGKEGFGVAQLDFETNSDQISCGVVYAGAVRGAIKLSASDPGTIFPYVVTDEIQFC